MDRTLCHPLIRLVTRIDEPRRRPPNLLMGDAKDLGHSRVHPLKYAVLNEGNPDGLFSRITDCILVSLCRASSARFDH